MTGCLHSMQPIPADLHPVCTQSLRVSSEYTSCNCHTGHFAGSPGSVRRILAGSVGMVLIFFATSSGDSRKEIVLLYDFDIFCPSRPGILDAGVSLYSGSIR